MIEEECTTPRLRECRIPVTTMCPPPPKKKPACRVAREPPKNGYFQPPDLDALFSALRRREACAAKVQNFSKEVSSFNHPSTIRHRASRCPFRLCLLFGSHRRLSLRQPHADIISGSSTGRYT